MKKLLVYCTLIFALFPYPCRANNLFNSDALKIELGRLADEFKQIVDKKGGGAVAVGEFSGSSDLKAGVGPRIQLTLVAELEARKLVVSTETYRFEIKGDYQPVVDKDSSLLCVKIIGRLIDRETGEPLAEKPTSKLVFGAETVPAMLGINVHVPPTADAEERSKLQRQALKKPETHLAGTRISTTPDCPYAIEILVKTESGYVARAVELNNKGLPFVPLNPSDVYGIRLINNSSYEAAVDLRVDGVNCFQFSEVKGTYWLVKAKSHLDILGWHKNNSTSQEFKVVADFPDTAAAKLKLHPSTSIGLITASFSASWENDTQRPPDEGTTRGTGFGNEFKFESKQVSRTVGSPRDTISVRYER